MVDDRPAVRIGTLSILGLIVLFVMQVCFAVWIRFDYGSWFGQAFWIALMWLGVSVNSLVCFAALASWRRSIVGAVVLLVEVVLMAFGWSESSFRYVIMFGFLTTWIAVTATFLRLPPWFSWRDDRTRKPQPIRFTIRSVLLITTIVAVLMAATRLYEAAAMTTPLAAVPLFGLLAVLSSWTMLASSRLRSRAIGLTAVLLVGSWSYSMLAFNLEMIVADQVPLGAMLGSFGKMFPDAFIIQMHLITFGVFTLGMCVIYALGRLDDRDFRMRKRRFERQRMV